MDRVQVGVNTVDRRNSEIDKCGAIPSIGESLRPYAMSPRFSEELRSKKGRPTHLRD